EGDSFVGLDLLLKNTGPGTIRQLRLALPYPMVDLTRLRKLKNIEEAERTFAQMRRRQSENIQITTKELDSPDADQNWIYRTLAHVEIDRSETRDGSVAIKREGHQKGEAQVSGFIKRGWQVCSPPETEIDHWGWFFLAINQITIVDIAFHT